SLLPVLVPAHPAYSAFLPLRRRRPPRRRRLGFSPSLSAESSALGGEGGLPLLSPDRSCVARPDGPAAPFAPRPPRRPRRPRRLLPSRAVSSAAGAASGSS